MKTAVPTVAIGGLVLSSEQILGSTFLKTDQGFPVS